MDHSSICRKFGEVFGAKAKYEKGVCMVQLVRNFDVHLMGKKSNSAKGNAVFFESLDEKGDALNLSETVIEERELPAFTQAITKQGLIIGAIHNHWIYDNPKLMYVHVQSVEPPLKFARKMAYAFSKLASKPMPK
ncbi:DUF1259 domain-containing protein [Aciduricibacillus chroicocephali]|uniref:DUF1259 domain-containing protein n=1 Tax=Aciduricibacillus chroicocephali TaxID=3054939 RepID=A0ABY9KW68_9BACI|nr:DUF1259 domain-containing protein [Bacillaceae bacterium 44XB]